MLHKRPVRDGSRPWRNRYLPLETRLWGRVEKRDGGCWPFIGKRTRAGYGQIKAFGKATFAHRVAYVLVKGPIPDGLVVMHACDNPPCCNPDHLSVGTYSDNAVDARNKGRLRPVCGEDAYQAKLTAEQVAAIRNDSRPSRHVAADYGIAKSTVRSIRQKRAWKHVDAGPEPKRQVLHFNDEQVLEIRMRTAAGESSVAIGRELGVHRRYIRDVARGKVYKHVGGPIQPTRSYIRVKARTQQPAPSPSGKGGGES